MQNDLVIDSRYFYGALVAVIVYDVASLAVYTLPFLQWPLLAVIILAILYLTIRDLRWLVILPVAELAWGSFGSSFQWFFGETRVSIRMLLFVLCMGVGIARFIVMQDKKGVFSFEKRGLWCALMLPVLWGVVRGYLRHNDYSFVYLDANAYVYLGYIPLWMFVMSRNHVMPLISTVAGVTVGLALKTLVLLNVFINNYEILNVRYLYLWVRDTRIGEITPVGDSLYRIFIQSQLYIALAFSAVASYLLQTSRRLPIHFFLAASLFFAALVVSFSRSYWLGVVGATVCIFFLYAMTRRLSFNTLRRFVVRLLGIMVGGGGILLCVFAIPSLGTRGLSGFIISRVMTSTTDPAGASRVQQLPPLIAAIESNALLGSGFGTVVTYSSSDPRIKNIENPRGLITTYAFEWGYLDQLLKFGLVAFSLYMGALLYLLVYSVALALREPDNWLPQAAIAGLLCLMIINITSPYLNHPLGLGYVALAAVFLLNHLYSKPA